MTDTDRGHRAPTSRASLVILVVLLTALSPFGWDFLLPRFVEMATVAWNTVVGVWNAVVDLGTWIFDNVVAPVVAWLA